MTEPTNPIYQPDRRTNRERMRAGDPYIAVDPDLQSEANRAAVLTANVLAVGNPARIVRQL